MRNNTDKAKKKKAAVHDRLHEVQTVQQLLVADVNAHGDIIAEQQGEIVFRPV